ncbi:AraC family transcriptional regulator [Micromonospora sp. NPDC126480]|uniref:AraC family transcriptional regulator n=1 Tax=Micromonospora sp. NPDC126480 TaxID=3155312 RepID=UPI0033265035
MCQPSWGCARAAAQRLRDLAVLRRVRDRIDREYARPLDVEALARGVHLPAGQLSRQFRLAYGKLPYAYLKARRAERAMVLRWRGEPGVALTGRSPAAVSSSGPAGPARATGKRRPAGSAPARPSAAPERAGMR